MKEPAFWYAAPGAAARSLAPLGWLYGAATERRVARGRPRRLGIPVISVGNINAGGTGKTPTVIALVETLRARGHMPHVVSRGYGGRLSGPVSVDPARHSAEEVGDEPLLLAMFADVWVARDRAAGGLAAEADGATILVLDDAHQNPALAKDLSFVVVDAARGFGNGACIPAGPLREPIAAGLARADVVVTIGEEAAQQAFDMPAALPRLRAALRPLQTGMVWSGQPFLAFAGIGQPAKFFATLRAEGADLVRTEALDDHAPLSHALLRRLEADAAALGAQLVTTEKDAARLPRDWRGRIMTLPVRLTFEDADALAAQLAAFPAP